MSNKHLSQAPSNLVKAKLKVLLESVNDMYASGLMVTESDITSAYHSALDVFFESLDNSISNSTSAFMPGLPADPLQYNILTNSLGRDLDAMFSEIGALDNIITSSFNSITATRQQILQKSRRISNKLGDYLLYADPSLGAGYFFGDSFNSAERIETGSSLIETEECFLGQDEGIVLLPLNGSPETPEIDSYTINELSNGALGNNADPDVVGKDDLAALSDNEPNTWAEYDRVTAYVSDTPLLLDITISLKSISIINHIHINPINFGTPTPIKIMSLETSKDGVEYVSVKDEVPVKDFVAEEEDNDFELSSATSKYAGQGFYSFLPRKAQFIHVVFEQHTPYSIQTVNGQRLRYAIGLRDINILGRKFKPEGSLISTPFSTEQEIRKVSLWASENPIEKSLLADVSHSITNNDGATWYGIQPTSRDAFGIQEVINFNNISSNSITTLSPVNTLRHKIYMKRDTEAFESNVTVSEERTSKIDIVSIPVGGDLEADLSEKPISSTIKVLLPFWGSYSCPRTRAGDSVAGQSYPMELDHVDFTVDVPPAGTLRYSLPYKGFSNLREHLRVFINGEQWEYAHKDKAFLDDPTSTSYSTAIDSESKVYFLNKGGSELQFGFTDSDNAQRGKLPPTAAKIGIVLDGDNPQLELTSQGYVLSLSASSDSFKENTSIVYFENTSLAEAIPTQIDLPRGKRAAKVPSVLSIGTYHSAGVLAASEALSATDITSNLVAKAKYNASITDKSLYRKPASFAATVAQISEPTKSIGIVQSIGDALAAGLAHAESLRYDHDILIAGEGDSGLLPPVFDSSIATIFIREYDSNGDLDESKTWTAVEFIDGEQELKYQSGGLWIYDPDRFSFDSYTGTVYIGSDTSSTNRTVFTCSKLKATVLSKDNWEFYKDPYTGGTDPRRILLSPEAVVTLPQSLSVSAGEKSIDLTPDNIKAHDWFNQRVLKGTVKPDAALFTEEALPVEVPFIDGTTELTSLVEVVSEVIDFGTAVDDKYSFTLKNISADHTLIGPLGFGALRNPASTTAPENIFQTEVTGTPVANGEWSYVSGTVTVYWDSTPDSHTVTYKYNENDSGVDVAGLYSIDYLNGVLHLSAAAVNDGNIIYQVSIYSAFYNIAEIISDTEINEINEEAKKVIFSDALGMRFLKLDTAAAARPPFMKIVYDYYKTSTESIKDLEPYFSPICKDIAFRAVTADILEEL